MLLATEHTYPLTSGPNSWASLQVSSRAGRPENLPIFLSTDTIKGAVLLNLPKAKQINSVIVEIRGIVNEIGEHMKEPNSLDDDSRKRSFLFMEAVVWNAPENELGNLKNRTFFPGIRKADDGSVRKLQGQYQWPYIFILPKIVKLSTRENLPEQSYPLPPHFTESAVQVLLVYAMTLRISTGSGLFKSEPMIKRQFGVVPNRRPPLSSPVCQVAYVERAFPPGPTRDPEGWEVLTPVACKGTLPDGTGAVVDCTIVYTRGYPLHLKLILESTSAHALDTVVKYTAPLVCLIRNLSREDPSVAETANTSKTKTDWRNDLSCIAMGICWRSIEDEQDSKRKTLNCEVQLKKDLTPSFSFHRLSVQHCHSPFKTIEFKPKSTHPIIMQKVDIVANLPAEDLGHRPSSLAPTDIIEPPLAAYEGWRTGPGDPWAVLTAGGAGF